MNLKLDRPLCFFDIETTGLDIAKDRIVSISVLKAMPEGEIKERSKKINPTIPIPEEATEVHGISDEDVKDCPTFKKVANSIHQFLDGCDLGGYNCIYYDIPLLAEEFLRCGIDYPPSDVLFVDCCTIFRNMERRNLEAAYKFYCDKELKDAHDSKVDNRATFEVFKGQLERYPELSENLRTVADFCKKEDTVDFAGKIGRDADGDYIYLFGKDRGKKIKEDTGFAEWMLKKEFTENTKSVVRKILAGIADNNERNLFSEAN